MKVLVTGGAGYIGSITVTKLINEGFEVSILDDLSTGHKENIHPKANFIEGSILDSFAIDKALDGCDVIIHLAAKSIVSESVQKPELYKEVNVEGTRILLDRATHFKVSKFIFASTASVYSPKPNEIVSENSEVKPDNPYGKSKANAEKLISSSKLLESSTAVVFRFFNVAGAYKQNTFVDLYENHHPETHLIPNLIAKHASNDFYVYGNDYETIDGTCVRDYLHVLDIVEAFMSTIKTTFSDSYNLLNLGTGEGYSILEVIGVLNELLHTNIKIQYRERRPGDTSRLVTSYDKAKLLIDWSPMRKIEDILRDYL
ncbi:MAG: UDP-glucose 4-epimerase GalE [Actinomycetes bacterium]